jgi:hypothetical protein
MVVMLVATKLTINQRSSFITYMTATAKPNGNPTPSQHDFVCEHVWWTAIWYDDGSAVYMYGMVYIYYYI